MLPTETGSKIKCFDTENGWLITLPRHEPFQRIVHAEFAAMQAAAAFIPIPKSMLEAGNLLLELLPHTPYVPNTKGDRILLKVFGTLAAFYATNLAYEPLSPYVKRLFAVIDDNRHQVTMDQYALLSALRDRLLLEGDTLQLVTTVTHGDLWFGNLLVDGNDQLAIIDWEFSHRTGLYHDLARYVTVLAIDFQKPDALRRMVSNVNGDTLVEARRLLESVADCSSMPPCRHVELYLLERLYFQWVYRRNNQDETHYLLEKFAHFLAGPWPVLAAYRVPKSTST